MKKFFGVIGNPPYQEELEGTSAKQIYPDFMDESFKVGEKVELITPARFLFNAGKTPKAWNEKMLSDEHLSVLHYESDSGKVFPGMLINGGVAITYHDDSTVFGAIGTYTPFELLNTILGKVKSAEKRFISDIAFSSESYKFTDAFLSDYPIAEERLSAGHSHDVVTNVFDKLPEVFHVDKTDENDYARVLGRAENQRCYRYIKRDYIEGPENYPCYKVFIPKSDGAAGTVGKPIPARISGAPVVALPYDGHTQTFMSIGSFSTLQEAESLFVYIKTKFARCLLGTQKVTQHNPPEKWSNIPLQDFTPQSDIDWSKSISEIDRQLYKKYGLDAEEIEFIETHVKGMS